MEKDTTKILEELKGFSEFRDFYNENAEQMSDATLSEQLNELIAAKGLSKSEIIERAEMSEIYAYQIMSGVKPHPSRTKLLCLAVGMSLSLDEVQTLLKKTGYPQLYVKNLFDSIVIYGVCNRYTIPQINDMLYEYGEETLG